MRVVTSAQFAAIVARGVTLSTRSAEDMYMMGGVIYDIWTSGHIISGQPVYGWRVAGFESYLDMVDDRFGIGAKTATKMKNMWSVLEVQLGQFWNRRLRLPSWEKMYLVSLHAQRATVSVLLRDAATKTVKALEQEALDMRAREIEDGSASYNFQARLTDVAKIREVKEAIAHFNRDTGFPSHAEFIYHMSRNYNQRRRRR